MKTIIFICALILAVAAQGQRIINKGSFILYANGAGDTVSIQKDKISVRQIGLIVDLEVMNRQSPISLYYSDFGYSNSTQLRQYIEKILYRPELAVYNKTITNDTLILQASDNVLSFSFLVSGTDTAFFIGNTGNLGNMVTDTAKFVAGERMQWSSGTGVLKYGKLISKSGTTVTFSAIKNE